MEKYTRRRLTISEYRHFGFSFGLGMAFLTLIGWWRHFPSVVVWITAGLCVYHWLTGLLLPRWLWLSEWIVFSLWKAVSEVISRVALLVLFYGLLTPFFGVLRFFGQDHIRRNEGKWEDFSPQENDPKRMERWF